MASDNNRERRQGSTGSASNRDRNRNSSGRTGGQSKNGGSQNRNSQSRNGSPQNRNSRNRSNGGSGKREASRSGSQPARRTAPSGKPKQNMDARSRRSYNEDYSGKTGIVVEEPKQKKHKNLPWVIALVLELVLVLVLVGAFAYEWADSRLDRINKVDLNETKTNEDMKEETVQKMTGTQTFVLYGLDTRDLDLDKSSSRSDCMIICVINNDTKKVKLVSVYRDTILDMGDDTHGFQKAAHAYAYGCVQQSINMLNTNLDLNIQDFVTVNFTALEKAIDAMGGLDIEVKESELKKLNDSIREQMYYDPSMNSSLIDQTGLIHMDGVQATAWARVRATDQGDITRTWRQRTVISKMIEKAKQSDLDTLLATIDSVVDYVSTSLSKDEIMSLAKNFITEGYELDVTTGFPFTWNTMNHDTLGSILIPCDLETNVKMLHKFLYGNDTYEASDTVKNTSQEIVNMTGFTNTLDIDTFRIEDDPDSIANK